jgi:hypothetical protein
VAAVVVVVVHNFLVVAAVALDISPACFITSGIEIG